MKKRLRVFEWALAQTPVLSWKPTFKTSNSKGEFTMKKFSNALKWGAALVCAVVAILGWAVAQAGADSTTIELSPADHNFGKKRVSLINPCKMEPAIFSLQNNGSITAEVEISLKGANPNDFEIIYNEGYREVLADDWLEIKVKFCPVSTGDRIAKLYVYGRNCNSDSLYLRGFGWKPCFLAGTQITIVDESCKRIENIKVGDRVKSYDVAKSKLTDTIVTKVYRHGKEEMTDYYVVINKTFRVTPNHKLYINDKWTEAGKAKPGDRLLKKDGSYVVVKSVKKVFERVPTYSFEVADQHTYFACDVLVAQKVIFNTVAQVVEENGQFEGSQTLQTSDGTPKAFVLSQNYPNPFNPVTEIEYTLPKECHVKLVVFNLCGQKVITLVDEGQYAGYKSVSWDASSFASGIYFYRLQAEDFVQMRKMVLMR